MSRTGDQAGYVRAGPTVLINEPPSVGRVPDCMRRCFSLPTPPPDEPTDRLLAYMWLSNVWRAGERAARPLTWPDVARLHPALQVAEEGGVEVSAHQVTRALQIASDAWTWSYLTEESALPGWLAEFLPAGAAGWMDEGILCRWLLTYFGDLAPVLERVGPLITASATKRVRTTLRQLGVEPARHPGRSGASKS